MAKRQRIRYSMEGGKRNGVGNSVKNGVETVSGTGRENALRNGLENGYGAVGRRKRRGGLNGQWNDKFNVSGW